MVQFGPDALTIFIVFGLMPNFQKRLQSSKYFITYDHPRNSNLLPQMTNTLGSCASGVSDTRR